jgi:hypothetical protein
MTKKHVHHGGAAATHRHGGLPLQVPRDRDPLIARGAGDALVWMAEEAAAVAAPPWVSVWTWTTASCDLPRQVRINALRRG